MLSAFPKFRNDHFAAFIITINILRSFSAAIFDGHKKLILVPNFEKYWDMCSFEVYALSFHLLTKVHKHLEFNSFVLSTSFSVFVQMKPYKLSMVQSSYLSDTLKKKKKAKAV